ncbi:hypothetical protein EUX98_g5937 [Antrodiella citrinella]|uniref:Uncharacterized protein n=1 Tax=Antrodiella citrinella TaxID=2447956 RepID=A0A4S4MST9_9APHY|nr:hypothetical protein EUX98_g5937 [Antrodiella citrinella]
MLVFCEVQRMLLALRGWVIYTDILWPRLMTPHADFRFSPLPLRGVFSEDSEFVKEMYRIGVPVWYIRPTITFWKGTAIIQSTPFIPARAAFSTTTVMRLGQFNLNAPAWLRVEADDDPTTSSLLEKIDKISVSNYALVGATYKYDPSIATALYRNTVERAFDLDAGAPSLPMSNLSAEAFGHIEDVRHAMAVIDNAIEEEVNVTEVETMDMGPVDNEAMSPPQDTATYRPLSPVAGPSHLSQTVSSRMHESGWTQPAAGRSDAPVAGPSRSSATGWSLPPRPAVVSSSAASTVRSSLPPPPSFLPPRPKGPRPNHPLASPVDTPWLSMAPVTSASLPSIVESPLLPPPSYLPSRPNALPDHPLALVVGSEHQASYRRVAGDSARRSNQPTARADWVPAETRAWAAALSLCNLVDHAEDRLLYALPSPHMFYRYASDNASACRMLHNWLRIREWCILQVMNGAQQGRVLMTREEWRIALDGNYYQLVDVDPEKCPFKASPAEIAELPLRPVPLKERNRVEGDKASKRRRIDNNHNDRRVDRRLGTRVDINVRFGVHAQFVPHEETSRHRWGGREYTLQQLSGKGVVWGEVVWELAVMSFRLELMQVDRALCSGIYNNQADGAWHRTNMAAKIWSIEGWITPPWTYKMDEDCLATERMDVRGRALARFARLMSVWPSLDPNQMHPMQQLLATSPNTLDASHDVAIFSFYICSAHSILGRIPTFPLQMPPSVRPIRDSTAVPYSFEGLHVNNVQID